MNTKTALIKFIQAHEDTITVEQIVLVKKALKWYEDDIDDIKDIPDICSAYMKTMRF